MLGAARERVAPAGRASSSGHQAPVPRSPASAALARASSRRCFIPLPSPHLQRVFQQRHFRRDMAGALGTAQQSRLIPAGGPGQCQAWVSASAACLHLMPSTASRPGRGASEQRRQGAAPQVQQSSSAGAAGAHSRSVLSSSSASHTPMVVLFSWENAVACRFGMGGGRQGRRTLSWTIDRQQRTHTPVQAAAPRN